MSCELTTDEVAYIDKRIAELQAENERLLDELADERAETEWMHEFLGRMAERIRGDADVHNLVGYVDKIDAENAKLLMRLNAEHLVRQNVERENAKLRELVRDMAECMDNSQPRCKKCKFRELNCQWFEFDDRMRELGVEVDA